MSAAGPVALPGSSFGATPAVSTNGPVLRLSVDDV